MKNSELKKLPLGTVLALSNRVSDVGVLKERDRTGFTIELDIGEISSPWVLQNRQEAAAAYRVANRSQKTHFQKTRARKKALQAKEVAAAAVQFKKLTALLKKENPFITTVPAGRPKTGKRRKAHICADTLLYMGMETIEGIRVTIFKDIITNETFGMRANGKELFVPRGLVLSRPPT